MPDSNLHKRISELEIQNQELITENKRLREMLGLPEERVSSKDENRPYLNFIEEESISTSSINKYSLPKEKIELFMSLFRGRSEIQLSSYDRMFPNQDYMPKGGFGNLIALPLQGGARRNGNCEFVDENFQSCPDQWTYLTSIRKMKQDDMNSLLAELCIGNGFGELGDLKEEDEDIKSWERKKIENLESKDFPNALTIVEANRLNVKKEGFSPKALNRIKRLSAFQNLQFYKTQKMRRTTICYPCSPRWATSGCVYAMRPFTI